MLKRTPPDEYEAALGLAWMGVSAGSTLPRLLKEMEPQRIWRASAGQLVAWGATRRAAEAFVEARKGVDVPAASTALAKLGLRLLSIGSPAYPAELLHLESPPAGLFVRSSVEPLKRLLDVPRISIVGTRKATPEGLQVAEAFARAFATRGVTVVSGMAIGIDAQVHRSTLDEGGLTVAILGCGADVVYPRSHRCLYETISERGIVASELPPGSRPTRWTFPYRNRLLAALGDAVLVVQGSNKSGALQTAKWALELGRPVFSVPGSIMRRENEGCNTLLYEGAVPALDPEVTVEDFLQQTRIERGKRRVPDGELAASPGHDQGSAANPEDSRQRQVLDAVGTGPVTADRLVVLTGLSVREVGAALGGLEAAGKVIRGGPGTYLPASRPP